MLRAAQRGRFTVYVFDEVGVRHHEPHSHVRWPNGSMAVRLSDFEGLTRGDLPTEARALLRDHAAAIIAAWNRLNPGRPHL